MASDIGETCCRQPGELVFKRRREILFEIFFEPGIIVNAVGVHKITPPPFVALCQFRRYAGNHFFVDEQASRVERAKDAPIQALFAGIVKVVGGKAGDDQIVP